MDNIFEYRIKGRGVWKHQPSTNVPLLFNQAIMFPIAKMWMQFICTQISPALNAFNVNAIHMYSDITTLNAFNVNAIHMYSNPNPI